MQQFGSRMKPMHFITTQVQQVSFQYLVRMVDKRFQIHLSTSSIQLLSKRVFSHKNSMWINLMRQSQQSTTIFSRMVIEELRRQKVAQKLDGDLLTY